MSRQNIITIIFLALAAIFSFISWYGLKKFLYGGVAPGGVTLLLIVLSFLITAALLALLVVFSAKLRLPLAAIFLSNSVFLIIFGAKPAYLIVAIISFLVAFIYAYWSGNEKQANIKFVIRNIIKPTLVGLFTSFSLFVAAVLYFSPPAQELKAEIKIPRSLFDMTLSSAAKIIESIAQTQISQPLGLPMMVEKVGGLDLPGVSVKTEKKTGFFDKILTPETRDQLYQDTNKQINFFIQPYKRYLPYGVAVGAFFALKALSFVFVFFSTAIAKLIFAFMKKTQMVVIKKEMVEREVIEL